MPSPFAQAETSPRRQPRLVSAFANSLNGLTWAMRREAAVRDEVAALVLAVPAAALVARDIMTFVAMVGVIVALIAVELLNTAVEKLADHVAPYRHPAIGVAKDVGSAAVFVMLMLCGLVWLGVVVERFMGA